MPLKARKGRLILIDAHSLIYRAFFALPPMSTSSGEVTNAVYGFTSMLAIVLASRPEYAAAAFDLGGPTFRSVEYTDYKAGRRAMPDDLRPQIQRVREVLEAFSIPIYGVPGFEADDVVGTLAQKGEEMGLQVTIVSGDLDCLQCVTDSVDALVPRRGITDTTVYGPDQVRQRYNLEPAQLIDYKALRGDTSDNIPGVPGVGEKTASQLVGEFGSIENLLANLDQLKPGRVRDALEANSDRVRLGKRLVTIRRDVDVQLDLDRSRWTRYDADVTRRLFDELEFRQLLARFPPPDSVSVPVQPTLAFEPVAPAEGVRLVDGEERMAELLRRLDEAEEVGVFGLWDGAARDGSLVGLGLGFGEESYYLPLRHQGNPANLPLDRVAVDVTHALRGLELLGHDVKEMQLALDGLDPHPYRWGFSSSIAAYLLGAGARDPRLEDLARDFLGTELVPTDQLLGTGRNARPPSATEVSEAANYTAGRARACFNLRPRLAAEMRNLGVDYLFHEVELPLARVLAGMEAEGVAIDVPYLAEVAVDLGGQLAVIEAEVATLAEEIGGQRINLNAPQQLAKLLFEDLKLPVGKKIKTGYSTDAETLEGLRDKHPIIGRILEHRQLSKLKSTYVDSLPLLVDPRDGRVHTSLNQAATATGRLSSSNPNLMNIPIRTELGQRIRRAFVAGRPGHLLFSADYSQIELRIAAHLSEDPNLLSAFEAGQDIHAATAARVFKVPIELVTPDQRRLAKIANFGSLYGQGEYGLSMQMGIPGDEAREFLKEYWATYARLRSWLDGVREKAREEGLVVSPTGRRRAIPDLRSPNYQLRAAAERMAINFPIQSLAADIIKIAMVRLDREMEESRLEGRMILQVHDELVFEIPEREGDAFAEMVPRVMVSAYELQGGLEVEAKSGTNWAEVRRVAALRA
ncbi:MAG TPA: DNA polymerase I [Candidatus Dormibacteraeota bacterium]|nr:DNA polymerase I [Candidatus Dormibacteraeota bacterium]